MLTFCIDLGRLVMLGATSGLEAGFEGLEEEESALSLYALR